MIERPENTAAKRKVVRTLITGENWSGRRPRSRDIERAAAVILRKGLLYAFFQTATDDNITSPRAIYYGCLHNCLCVPVFECQAAACFNGKWRRKSSEGKLSTVPKVRSRAFHRFSCAKEKTASVISSRFTCSPPRYRCTCVFLSVCVRASKIKKKKEGVIVYIVAPSVRQDARRFSFLENLLRVVPPPLCFVCAPREGLS